MHHLFFIFYITRYVQEWGLGVVYQIFINVTFIRNKEVVFQIFMFLCVHEIYMAYMYAWSQWSQLQLFPLKSKFRFKGFLFYENFHGRKFSIKNQTMNTTDMLEWTTVTVIENYLRLSQFYRWFSDKDMLWTNY